MSDSFLLDVAEDGRHVALVSVVSLGAMEKLKQVLQDGGYSIRVFQQSSSILDEPNEGGSGNL